MFKRLLTVIILAIIITLPVHVLAVEPSTDSHLTRDQRLNNAVSEQSLQLSDSAKQLIVAKCSYAQNSLIKIQSNTDKIIGLRTETYSMLQRELQAIKLRMARQGVDASEIDLLIGKIQQGLDNLTLTSDAYNTTLGDVINVNCAQNPEQFQAGLVVLRSERADLLKAASDIKAILHAATDNTFYQLKKRLTI